MGITPQLKCSRCGWCDPAEFERNDTGHRQHNCGGYPVKSRGGV